MKAGGEGHKGKEGQTVIRMPDARARPGGADADAVGVSERKRIGDGIRTGLTHGTRAEVEDQIWGGRWRRRKGGCGRRRW